MIRKVVFVGAIALATACGPGEDNNGDGNAQTNGATNGTPNGATNGTPNGATNGAPNGATNGDTTGGAVSFTDDISPLVNESCNNAGCHAAPGQKNFSIDGDTPADIATALDGVASDAGNNLVEPSDPTSSEIYIRVSGMARTQMPLTGGPLEDTQIQMIEDWIAAGAPFDN